VRAPVSADPPASTAWPSVPDSEGARRSLTAALKPILLAERFHLILTPLSTMERSSTTFAISSQFYDNLHNRGRYHRAAGTPPAPGTRSGDTRKRPVAQTYTWFVEQELAALSKEISETRQWVFEQQAYFGLLPKDGARRNAAGGVGPAGREPDADAEMANRLREHLRAAERHWERSKLQEEFDKMESRWRERAGREERRRRQEQQWAEEQRARVERQKVLESRSQEEAAWRAYERRWTAIASEGGQLKFKSVPWPTTVPPRNVAEITPAAVARFIFSPAHSQGMSRKERIKNALRRWHPDRFGRMLSRVAEKDKAAVERGVGIVARCLNDLLAQEN